MAPPNPTLRIVLRGRSKRVAQRNRTRPERNGSRPESTSPPSTSTQEQESEQTSCQATSPPSTSTREQEDQSSRQAPPESGKNRRQKLKEKNPQKYEKLREFERKRSQLYRLEMTEKERENTNRLAALRQRRYRQRKKDEEAARKKEEERTKIKDGNKRKTRGDIQKELGKKKKETDRKRQYRQSRTAEQREEHNRKRREAYSAKKERERQDRLERERERERQLLEREREREMERQAALEYLDLPCFVPSTSNSTTRRKRRSRVKRVLPSDATQYVETVVDMITRASPRKKAALKRAGFVKEGADKKRRSLEKELTNIVTKEARRKGSKKYVTAALNALKKARLQRFASKQLGINRKAITKATKKKAGRKPVSKQMQDLVCNFYEQIAHSIPNKKLVSKKTGKPRMVLPRSIDDAYEQFKKVYPHIKIGRTNFGTLRPSHVKPQSQAKYYGCLCEQCENIRLKIVAIDPRLQLDSLKLKDPKKIANMTLCEKGEGEQFHKLGCIRRECQDCGVQKLKDHFLSLGPEERSQPITWKKWANVDVVLKKTAAGKKTNVKRKALITMGDQEEKTMGDLIKELEDEMQAFPLHLFTWFWQAKQFRAIRENLPSKWIVNVWDFAENYTCISQNEAQSAYWTRNQVTIHPVVNYYSCEEDGCSEQVTESVVFISSDNSHDFHAVHTYMDILTSHLHQKRNLSIEKMIRYSDGCAGQYKSRGPLADIAHSSLDYNFATIHNYFGSRHGKGPSDGESAVVKSKASMAVKSGTTVINTAQELYNFCTDTLEKDVAEGCCTHYRRSFYLVDDDDVQRNRERCQIKTVNGTRSLHSVTEFGNEGNQIRVRRASCFCDACLIGNEKDCKNADYVDDWTVIPLTHQSRKGAPKPKDKTRDDHSASDQSEDEFSDQPADVEYSDQSEDENSDQSEDENSNQAEDENSDQSEDENSNQAEDENSDQSEDDMDPDWPGMSGRLSLKTKPATPIAKPTASCKPTAILAAPCKPTAKPATPCEPAARASSTANPNPRSPAATATKSKSVEQKETTVCFNQNTSRHISNGNFVAVKAGLSKWYAGQVLSIDEEKGEAEINFLKKVTGENYFIWPDKDDKAWQPSWVPMTTIILIPSPQVTQRGTKKWTQEEMAAIAGKIRKLK